MKDLIPFPRSDCATYFRMVDIYWRSDRGEHSFSGGNEFYYVGWIAVVDGDVVCHYSNAAVSVAVKSALPSCVVPFLHLLPLISWVLVFSRIYHSNHSALRVLYRHYFLTHRSAALCGYSANCIRHYYIRHYCSFLYIVCKFFQKTDQKTEPPSGEWIWMI
jgi:hypothetical protein